MEFLALLLFALIFIALMMGFPVALTLSGVSLIFALVAVQFGWFDLAFLQSIPNRILLKSPGNQDKQPICQYLLQLLHQTDGQKR